MGVVFRALRRRSYSIYNFTDVVHFDSTVFMVFLFSVHAKRALANFSTLGNNRFRESFSRFSRGHFTVGTAVRYTTVRIRELEFAFIRTFLRRPTGQRRSVNARFRRPVVRVTVTVSFANHRISIVDAREQSAPCHVRFSPFDIFVISSTE